ncbi:MAG TPA: HAD family hydrolase [Chthoniobacterales bacterium]
MKKLLLFDIDGTLITSGGAGETALLSGMRDAFGLENGLGNVVVAGNTDSGIARSILAANNLPVTTENVTRFLDGYLHHLPLELPRKSGYVLPGIVALLEKLKTRPNVVLALLTGNIVRGAEIKLSHYGLWHYFEFGAFADDHHDRNELGSFARARAHEKHGVEFPPEAIYVIGDTPRDIACGRAIEAKTVAIATGNYTYDQLLEHQPDFLFHDFSEVEAVIEELGW